MWWNNKIFSVRLFRWLGITIAYGMFIELYTAIAMWQSLNSSLWRSSWRISAYRFSHSRTAEQGSLAWTDGHWQTAIPVMQVQRLLNNVDEARHSCIPSIIFYQCISFCLFFIYYRRHTLYQCGELDKFIETVIGRVESIPVEKVAEVLNEFLRRYESIEVAYHFQWSYFFRWSSFLD